MPKDLVKEVTRSSGFHGSTGVAGDRPSRRSRTTARLNPRLFVFTQAAK